MAPPKLKYPAAEQHHRHYHHQRHPLSFPAVRPCLEISPSTLMASLIALAQTICNFNTNSFPTQRKNARETLRQIAILLVFFQELHDRGSVLRHCFTDLHVIFQKLHFLMLDCVNEGTRLWMLTKSQHVANEFRVLVRAMASTLGMLPLRSIDVSDDIKELVELVMKQGMRGKFEVDQNDEREEKRLLFVLNQFERGIEPDVDAVKQVLKYLGIKSWCACNKEVNFLQQELASNEEEVSLLSSLIGFLCYSRVVAFETIDFQSVTNIEQSEDRDTVEMLSCVVPDDFRCPISLEIMTDPVTISTGQTYDRISIQKWLKSGNKVCPKTREKLKGKELFPNTALKKLIQQFCADNGIAISNPTNSMNPTTITKTIEPGSLAAAHAVQFTSWFLSNMLAFGTDEQKNKAAYEIRLLAKSNVFNSVCLVEMGTVRPLLDLLTTGDITTQENAISALMKLSKHNSGKQVIIESRGLNPIVKVLKRGLSLESRHVAAAAVFYLCSVKENRKLIGENAEALSALVELVKDDGTIRNNAVVAIFGLLMRRENHSKIIAAGAVPALVNVLGSENGELVSDSLAVIVALVEGSVEGARAVVKTNNNIAAVLSGILESDAARVAREYCASILLALCEKIGDEVTCVLAKDLAVSVMPSLYSLLTGGTSHAAKKARLLVNRIQEFSDRKHYEMMRSSLLFPRQEAVTATEDTTARGDSTVVCSGGI